MEQCVIYCFVVYLGVFDEDLQIGVCFGLIDEIGQYLWMQGVVFGIVVLWIGVQYWVGLDYVLVSGCGVLCVVCYGLQLGDVIFGCGVGGKQLVYVYGVQWVDDIY